MAAKPNLIDLIPLFSSIENKKNWWGKNDSSVYSKAYPDKIIFKIIKEDASAYLALKNQEIDVTYSLGTVSYTHLTLPTILLV